MFVIHLFQAFENPYFNMSPAISVTIHLSVAPGLSPTPKTLADTKGPHPAPAVYMEDN